MKDEIQRQILKKKALDRWENEGGRACAESTPTIEGKPAKKPGTKDITAQKSKGVKVDRPDRVEKTK